MLWLLFQLKNSKENNDDDSKQIEEYNEECQFVDFNGFSVKFQTLAYSIEEEICGEQCRVSMYRGKISHKKISQNFETVFHSVNVAQHHFISSQYGLSLPNIFFQKVADSHVPDYMDIGPEYFSSKITEEDSEQ